MDRNRGMLTVVDAGRLGGLETSRRHRRAHFVEAGKKGQAAFKSKYTRADCQRWGRLGGRPRKHRYIGEEADLGKGGRGARPVSQLSPRPAL